jgi:membrane protease subunit (stomatin/prohibitin family)
MGLFDKLRGEFIDIIEWTEPSQNEILAYRFPRYNNEIKNGAKLTVREGQVAAFVREGQLADVKTPGLYTLDTNNMPILGTILGWKYGFESPFKAEVYFISTRQWTDQKWGTQNPIMMRDPEFGPIRIRAFGNYAFKVSEAATFMRELVATDPAFEAYEVTNQLRNTIVSKLVDVIGAAKMPILDLAGNYERLSQLAMQRIGPELAKMGLSITQFNVENVSLPPEVEAALDKRTQMGVLGNLDQYTKFQTAEAIRDAAQNPGGGAGLGAGFGAGMAIGNQMGAAFAPKPATTIDATVPLTPASAPQSAPPPLPMGVKYHVALAGKSAGPFELSVLQQKIQSGEIARATLVWKSGMANWVTADSVADLQPLFAHVPPPLPS